MPHRYFTAEVGNGRAALNGTDAHHLADVMRAKIGENVILCDAHAVEYVGTITSIQPGRVEFTVTEGYPSAAEPTVDVTLLVGYPKQDKLEQVIRHGVELGCDHFIPFFQPLLRGRAQERKSRKTSATTASPLKPPSSAAGASCRIWPFRCPTSGPSAAASTSMTSCSSATSAAAHPCASCWLRPRPPMAKS